MGRGGPEDYCISESMFGSLVLGNYHTGPLERVVCFGIVGIHSPFLPEALVRQTYELCRRFCERESGPGPEFLDLAPFAPFWGGSCLGTLNMLRPMLTLILPYIITPNPQTLNSTP